MIILNVIISIMLFANPCQGSVLDLPIGARSVSLGGAYTAVTGTPEALFFNPASLSTEDIFQVSFSGTHLFQMKELQYTAIAVNIAQVPGNAGLAVKKFGNSLYSEASVSVSWASTLGRKFHVGLTVKQNQLWIKGYGAEDIVLVDLGILWQVKKSIAIGGSLLNMGKSSKSPYRSSIPLIYRSGLSWRIAEDFLFCFDLVWEETRDLCSQFGCEFRIWQPVWIRFGIERDPSCFSSGIGIEWKNVVLDYAMRYHHCLGATHYGSVSFSL